jgi:hypothetical protein
MDKSIILSITGVGGACGRGEGAGVTGIGW